MKAQKLLLPIFFIFLFSFHKNAFAQPPCTCTNCPVPITDNNSSFSQIDVSVNGANDLGICGLKKVCFTISHTWMSDLSVSLTSPSGLHYLLMADNNNSLGGHGGNNSDNAEVCITTGASNPLTNNTSYQCNNGPCSLGNCCLTGNWTMPCGGVTDPIGGAVQSPNCHLNDFNVAGHPANGPWVLRVNDNCGQDQGYIENWSLTFICGTTSCTSCPNPPTTLMTTNSPVCEGGDILLGEIGGQATAWQWSGPNSFNATSQFPSVLNASPVNAGTYYVTITDAYSCTNTDSVEVVVYPPLQIDNLFDTTVCEWEKVPLLPSITGGSGNYSCDWSPGTGLNDPSSCTPVFQYTNSGAATITLTVTDNMTGCTATEDVIIANIPCCTPAMTGCNACNSQCTSSGTELVVNGDFSNAGNPQFTSDLINTVPLSNRCFSGSYHISPSAVNKCPNNSLWQHVEAPSCSGNYLIVDGANGTIWRQFVPVQPGETYNFSFDFYPDVSGGASPTLELWVANTPVLTGIVAPLGTWTSYCTSWTYTGTVPFSAKLEIRQVVQAQYSDYGIDNVSFSKCESDLTVTASPDTTICALQPVQLNTIVTGNSGAYTCTWSPTPYLSDPNICDPVFTPPSAGTYVLTVTVMDSDSCSNTDDVTITVLPLPNIQLTCNSPVCEGDILQKCEVGGDAVSWGWSGPNGFTSSQQCPFISPADPSHSGTYCVTITDANGCTNTDCISVEVFPSLMVTHPASINVCEWTSAPLSPTITGGSSSYSCSWSPVGNLNDPNSCTPNFSSSTQGTFPLTMTVTDNATGCMESIQFDVIVQNCCQPTTTSCTSCPYDCFTQGGDLVVNGDFSGGDTGFSSGLSSNCTCVAGTYCIDTNARNKCTNSLWKPIYSPNCTDNYMIVDGANGSIWSQTVTPTAGSTYNFGFDFFPNVSDGTSPMLELWVNGTVIQNSITAPLDQWSRYCASWVAPPPPAVPVIIEIRQVANGQRGDYGIDNIEFTECIPPPSVTIFSDTTICENEVLNLTTLITGGAPPTSCQWSPTAGINNPSSCNPTFKRQQAGVYPLQVVVTDGSGCTDTANVTVTVVKCCTPQSLSCNACSTCTALGTELVINGDFTQGNTGFTSSLNNNCTCAASSYCIGGNARDKCTVSQWQFIQAPDCDSFMIVDGPFGSGDIWVQTGIPVTAGPIL